MSTMEDALFAIPRDLISNFGEQLGATRPSERLLFAS